MRGQRFLAPILLLLDLLMLRNFDGFWFDVILFNSVPVFCVLSILTAPHIINKWAQPLTAAAIGSWTIGSILATTNSYWEISTVLDTTSDAMYLLFYPLALLGLQLMISIQKRLTALEIVDASIVGLGLSTLGAAFALQPVLPHFDGDLNQSFLAIIYPVADLVLVCVLIATVEISQ